MQARGVLEGGDDASGLEPLTPVGPDHHADVDQEDDQKGVDEVLRHQVEAVNDAQDEIRPDQAGDPPHQRAHHVVGGDVAQPQLEADDREREEDAEGQADEGPAGDGVVVPARPAERQHHEGAEQDEPHGDAFRGQRRGPPIANEAA